MPLDLQWGSNNDFQKVSSCCRCGLESPCWELFLQSHPEKVVPQPFSVRLLRHRKTNTTHFLSSVGVSSDSSAECVTSGMPTQAIGVCILLQFVSLTPPSHPELVFGKHCHFYFQNPSQTQFLSSSPLHLAWLEPSPLVTRLWSWCCLACALQEVTDGNQGNSLNIKGRLEG